MLALVMLWGLITAPPHLGLGAQTGPSRCDTVQMEADSAHCDKNLCHLEGHASLRCDTLVLWGDAIDLLLTDDQKFDGARASGNVLLVEGLSVVRCTAMGLQSDRIQGRVDGATIEVRKPPAPALDANGVPTGRNQVVVHGDIERLDHNLLTVHHGDLTLCDCGEQAAPSWRVDASSIDINLGDRATIWWPQVKLHLWPDTLVPITPPLLPLSLPLAKRAMGFLPPDYTFFSSPWPTVDLPFFVPMGDTWDITLSPGMRMDWTGTHTGGIHRLGAPRLGARVRYAPTVDTQGEWNVQLTHDGSHGMAAAALANVLAYDPAYLSNAINADQYAQRQGLVNRVALNGWHRSRLAPRLDWLADVHWVSDDLVNQDFLIALEQRVATYLPSRTALFWREPAFTGLAAVDYILRLDSTKILNGVRVPDLSNVGSAERTTLHRGPYLNFAVQPTALGHGLAAEGELTFVRYGNWTGASPETPHDVSQTIGGVAAGLSYNDRLGPLELTARAGFDSLLVGTEEQKSFVSTVPYLRSDAAVRFGRRLGNFLHVVAPRLSYRGMPAVWASSPLALAAEQVALDERLLRRKFEQGMLVLHQSLWSTDHPSGVPVVSFDIAQPVDLATGAMLQPWAQLNWNTAPLGTASAWTTVDLRRTDNDPVREIGAAWYLPVGPFALTTTYNRLAPDADRFQRSMYELAAPRLPPSPISLQESGSEWVHMLRATAVLRYSSTFEMAYTTAYQLPRPGHALDPNYIDPSCLNPDGTGARQCFTQHTVSVNYASPCECWGLGTVVSVFPQDPHHPRFQINLTIADYKVGVGSTGSFAAGTR